jgi:predicted permease
MGALLTDIRHAARSLRRHPLISAAAVLSLALGIGVNSAIFSVFDRLMLRTLAVPAPEEIVLVTSPGRKPGGASTGDSGDSSQVFSYPLFRDLERLENTTLSRIAAHRDFDANLASRGQTTRGEGLLVSGAYFQVLGVAPALGRLLTPDDDHGDGASVVVLADRYWKTHFGADASVIGQALVLNGESLTVVGVAPSGFAGTTTMDVADVFVPLALARRLHAGNVDRTSHWLYLFARLNRGATREQAQTALNGPFAALIRDVEWPALGGELTDRERPGFLARRIVLQDGSRGRQRARDQVSVVMVLLFSVTGLVLLIACANVANLLMTRAAERAPEIGVRLSIGASSARVVRLLLIEAVLLGGLGALSALAVAQGTSAALLGLMPAGDATVLRFELDRSMLIFTGLLGLGTGIVFGIFPAVYSIRSQSGGSRLRTRQASASRGAARFRTSLATAQIALATALLATAGLFVTSLNHLSRTDLGIERVGLVAFRLSPSLNGYSTEQARTLFERVSAAARTMPGVTSVTASAIPLLDDDGWDQKITVDDLAGGSGTAGTVNATRTDIDYFGTLGIELLSGRDFARTDADDAPKVAIVNRAFVKKFNLGTAALGHRLALGASERTIPDIEIVGVAADAKYSRVRDEPPPQLFMPYRQGPVRALTFYVRTTPDVRPVLAAIPSVVQRLDPNLPVEDLRTIDDQIWENLTRDRVLATLSSSFAALAALLAAIGLYAVLTYTVAQRFREFGIRLAIGATPSDVRRLIVVQVGRMAAIGTVIGLVAAVGLGHLGESLLFELQGNDPALIAGAAVAMGAIALAAGVLPARRALRVEPIAALRIE